jgi:hypothetical protein
MLCHELRFVETSSASIVLLWKELFSRTHLFVSGARISRCGADTCADADKHKAQRQLHRAQKGRKRLTAVTDSPIQDWFRSGGAARAYHGR